MTETSPVTQGTVCRLLTHKEHAVEMIESIIEDTDLDPCAEQLIEDLGASGLFDLARVCFSYILLYFMFVSFADNCLFGFCFLLFFFSFLFFVFVFCFLFFFCFFFFLGINAHEGASR